MPAGGQHPHVLKGRMSQRALAANTWQNRYAYAFSTSTCQTKTKGTNQEEERQKQKEEKTNKPWSRFQRESSAPPFTHPVVHIVGRHAMWTPKEGGRYVRSLGDSPTG